MARIRNSALLSTLGVLAAGGVFAYALYSFYPSSSDDAAVPVIKADAAPIRIEPVDVGGMDIPFRDSTVYDSMESAGAGEAKTIENLLEPSGVEAVEQPMTKEEVVAAVEKQISELENAEDTVMEVSENVTDSTNETLANISEAKSDIQEVKEKVMASSDLIAVPVTREKKPIRNILEDDKMASSDASSVPSNKELSVSKTNDAGTSPETLAFVRDVLNKKDNEKVLNAPVKKTSPALKVTKTETIKVEPQKIEPAAGIARDVVTQGSHYVQLASIGDRSRANAEWAKLKKDLSALPSASGYRVQEANLSKGTFYRIQAGPYSQDQAKSICESIKAQKPGGCLVVK